MLRLPFQSLKDGSDSRYFLNSQKESLGGLAYSAEITFPELEGRQLQSTVTSRKNGNRRDRAKVSRQTTSARTGGPGPGPCRVLGDGPGVRQG